MFSKKIKAGITLASTILVLTGCSTQALNTVNPTPGTNTTVTQSPINDLKFFKVSDENKSQYNNLISQNAVAAETSGKGTAGVSAPTATSSPMPMVAVAGDAKMAGGSASYPMMYFPQPGNFEEYIVTDFEEAKTAGFSGTYLKALTGIVKPITQKLGSDVRMVNSNGSSDENGVNPAAPGSSEKPVPYNGYYSPYQWQFTFVSSAKKEVYNIFISASETLVLRQKWGIKDLNPDEIKIDSSDAIKLIKTAIANKGFTSPDNQQQQGYYGPEAEILYEVPKDTSWYLYLEKDKGRLVWSINVNVNYNYPVATRDIAVSPSGGTTSASSGSSADMPTTNAVAPSIYPVSPEFWYSGGYARVDASTGEIISLTRPTRYRNTPVMTPPCCKTDPGVAPAVDPVKK